MLKASALYLVIVLALVISVLCSAVIAAGYYYRSYAQRHERYDQLRRNLQSGISLLLTSDPPEKKRSLFGGTADSLLLKKTTWGLFDAGTVRAFIQNDTLNRAFLIAPVVDSVKWAALYVIDEDRSISVSGHTHIRGDVFMPKAGIREAYVNNQAYTGAKKIVDGVQKTSGRVLPALLGARLQKLLTLSRPGLTSDSSLFRNDTTAVSFLKPAKCFNFKKTPATLAHVVLSGHILLWSDTSLTIDSSARLDNVVIFARRITVNSGFKGRCQLFAAEELTIGQRCTFTYPSAIGIFCNDEKNEVLKNLAIGDFCTVSGTVFVYEKTPPKLPPVISLGKHTGVTGQIYVKGLLNFKDSVAVFGAVFTHRFIYQTAYTRYENYLINLDIDAARLSRYYLTSDLLPVAGNTQKILQWLP